MYETAIQPVAIAWNKYAVEELKVVKTAAAYCSTTGLQKELFKNPYEALKQLTRTNEKVTAQTISAFVDTLDVDDTVKERIRRITPHNYLGYKAF